MSRSIEGEDRIGDRRDEANTAVQPQLPESTFVPADPDVAMVSNIPARCLGLDGAPGGQRTEDVSQHGHLVLSELPDH